MMHNFTRKTMFLAMLAMVSLVSAQDETAASQDNDDDVEVEDQTELIENEREFAKDIKSAFNDTEAEIEKFLEPFVHIPPTTNFLLFLLSLVFAMFWITYITFWNSRLVGSLATSVANKFVSGGYIKVSCGDAIALG